jgi:YD repeat-containing protein
MALEEYVTAHRPVRARNPHWRVKYAYRAQGIVIAAKGISHPHHLPVFAVYLIEEMPITSPTNKTQGQI